MQGAILCIADDDPNVFNKFIPGVTILLISIGEEMRREKLLIVFYSIYNCFIVVFYLKCIQKHSI